MPAVCCVLQAIQVNGLAIPVVCYVVVHSPLKSTQHLIQADKHKHTQCLRHVGQGRLYSAETATLSSVSQLSQLTVLCRDSDTFKCITAEPADCTLQRQRHFQVYHS